MEVKWGGVAFGGVVVVHLQVHAYSAHKFCSLLLCNSMSRFGVLQTSILLSTAEAMTNDNDVRKQRLTLTRVLIVPVTPNNGRASVSNTARYATLLTDYA
jgi:hypothetical protein